MVLGSEVNSAEEKEKLVIHNVSTKIKSRFITPTFTVYKKKQLSPELENI